LTIILEVLSKIILKCYSKVEVLEVIDDDEVKFEEKECVKELQVDFIESEGIKLNMEFSLACTHHKLNFEVHQSRTSYFVKCWI
jgi:hypothetical protein